ncbi:3-deoxy-7-phosphoheptulonate synthase [Permianibacter aggregans]|uniref:Phospho-2-dehydro-3-deoxyheptonate aldolase n=1 Tax=Permianibacter aggregans TaxID=1510150 RepID=A0A4R6URP5_9GAMM|nr:3-deoxy-7-phosphoheptulonate synthase [Permianibacter aggregans]QGX39514.1 3-deoxy-7-phosphoheptulonate synthase [Permianibacter aggregans]TDQ49741.1 3-deoxy-D-arabinoheptulosonate-7-phosphate synthase [Permianibacter aggregans]
MTTQIENLNVLGLDAMPSPREIKQRVPLSERATSTVLRGRRTVSQILLGADPRPLFIVGPCSIHDPKAGLDYAERLAALAADVADTLCVVMRVYFEKPRTTTGWKGFINDPHMNDTFCIEEGMALGRQFLRDVNELGLPAATEALDPISPQYYGDLVSWTAIGARTAESQTHREMASGLSTPVGFKNGTDGSLDAAINGIISASHPHSFLGINEQGEAAIIRTRGNALGHVVLRGGERPNYDSVSVQLTEKALEKAGLRQNIIIDCSHANSGKKAERQPAVLRDVVHQLRDGSQSIAGVMIESFIEAGNQAILTDRSQMKYGCSVTDACVSWEQTRTMLLDSAEALASTVARRKPVAA